MRTSHNLKGQPRKLKERQGLQQATTIYFNLEGWDSAFIDLAFHGFLIRGRCKHQQYCVTAAYGVWRRQIAVEGQNQSCSEKKTPKMFIIVDFIFVLIEVFFRKPFILMGQFIF